MDIRFAPMEGLTDTIYRRVHHQHFGGVEKYYIPFVSPTQHHVFTPKELRAIGPEDVFTVHVVADHVGRRSTAVHAWVSVDSSAKYAATATAVLM